MFEMSTIKRALILAFTFIACVRVSAQVRDTVLFSDFVIDFRWNRSVIDPDYRGNAVNIRALKDSLSSIQEISSISVVSYSSPEGQYPYNVNLSVRRAEAMRRFLDTCPPHSAPISIKADGESWHLFREKVCTSSELTESQRQAILAIIDKPVSADRRKALLQQYDPLLWKRIIRNWFPAMRRSFIRLEYHAKTGEPEPVRDTLFRASPAESPVIALQQPDFRSSFTVTTSYPKTIAALKTNLLYDAVTALNFEVEVPLGNRFSLVASDLFPWWTWGPNDRKYAFQIWEIGFEGRWYPFPGAINVHRDSRMSKFFVGPYVSSAAYDLQWDKSVCTQGEYWTAGLSAGYVFPLGRRLKFEMSASIGYLSSHYRQYQPDPDYEHLYRDPFRKGRYTYFGPTRLKMSLVLPLTITRSRTSGPYIIVAR